MRTGFLHALLFLILFFFFMQVPFAIAQTKNASSLPRGDTITPPIATDSAKVASLSAEEQQQIEKIKKGDLTKPEDVENKDEFLALFANRPIDHLTPFNFGGYTVQYAVKVGVPANTIILILLLPLLATIMVFIRHIIGLPSLELFVPIVFAITLVSTGLFAGAILLITIVMASTFARIILKRVRIMQLPKMALSIFVVAIFVFWALMVSASLKVLTVTQLSIFPILLLILLGEKIVALQLSRSTRETIQITTVTVGMGVLGFAILSFASLRSFVLLYPEIILLLIPIDVIMGRYFGLRLTEVFRFKQAQKYVSQ